MKPRNLLTKISYIIFIIIFVVLILPIDILATSIIKDNCVQEQVEPVELVGELEERRTLNEKHFLMSDGSVNVAIYSSDVHYLESGMFKDIDNTLIKNVNLILRKAIS